MVGCVVYPGLGLNYMQDLGVEETSNGLGKFSEERTLTKNIRVVGESSMHTLKRTGKEGIDRGTVEQ